MRWLSLVSLALVAQPANAQSEPLVFTNANVIDGVSAAPETDRAVVVRDGRIVSVTASSDALRGSAVVDLKGKFLLPGLVDAHVHVASTAQLQKALETGVTTLRSMGTSHFADVGLGELAAEGVIQSPEILAAGYHVTPNPAEALFVDEPSLADLWDGARGPDAFRRLAAANLERGVDWIKIASTERAGLPETDPRKQRMTLEEVSAVVDESTSRGVPVACHAHGDEGGRACVAGGARSIEHGTYLSRETIELMKERGTYLVPTVAIVEDLMLPGGDYDDPVLQVRGRHMLPRVMEGVATAHRLGVKVVAATDTGYREHSILTLQHEIEALTKCGLSPMEAIQAATSVAAELLGIEDRTGSIQASYEADLIVVDQNPLENILSLQDVLMVVNDGEIVLDRLSFALE